MKPVARVAAIAALSLAASVVSLQAVPPAQGAGWADLVTEILSFQGEATEQFLKNASVLDVKDLGRGITRPRKVTLEFDGLTRKAVFKDIDERRQGVRQFEDGRVDVGFQDSWQTEVAAYRLDKMIGLGMVPATIERPIQGDEGSLQWWVDAVMSEEDRVDQGLLAPDMEAWYRQRFKVWLFDELISNVDRHMNNLLITEDFQVRLIDHSRAFRENQGLRHPDKLVRFSRSLLDGLEKLTFDDLKAEIGRYLSDGQIKRVLSRRDAILDLARQRIAQLGEASVIYP